MVSESTAVPARTDPCGEPTSSCTVPPGVYHPWSETEAQYATVRAVDACVALRPFELDQVSADGQPDRRRFPEGTRVLELLYGGEGYCEVSIDGLELGMDCPSSQMRGEAPAFAALDDGQTRPPTLQLVRVPCEGGPAAWIEAAPDGHDGVGSRAEA